MMKPVLIICIILYVWMRSFRAIHNGAEVYSTTGATTPNTATKVDEVRQFHDEKKENDIMDLIISNSIHLIHLYHVSKPPRITSKGEDFADLSSQPIPPVTHINGENKYYGIKAVFCELSWEIQKDNPSLVPMFRDLVLNSEGCEQNRIEIDFGKVMKEIRRYDQLQQQQRGENMAIQPTGFIFHESRCGSTALANALAYSTPRFRVYSEPSPTLESLSICDHGSGANSDYNNIRCSRDAAVKFFQDVLYIMGRKGNLQQSNDKNAETHLFFKFQSSVTPSIDIVQEAFPKIPWVFVYRSPVQVLVSNTVHNPRYEHHQFRHSSKRVTPHCLRTQRRPSKGFLSHVFFNHNLKRYAIRKLPNEEYCALYLSYICQSIINKFKNELNIDQRMMGYVLNYDNLFKDFTGQVLPLHFNITLTDKEKARMNEISRMYSKSRNDKIGHRQWYDDSKDKDTKATKLVRDASKTYLEPTYQQLEVIQKSRKS